MVFVIKDVPVKFLSAESKPIEGLYIELNFPKKKWLLSYSYNPNKNNMNHLDALRGNRDLYSTEFGYVIFLGDLQNLRNHACSRFSNCIGLTT